MEPVFCVHCAEEFTPRNRLQSHCSKPECQRAREGRLAADQAPCRSGL